LEANQEEIESESEHHEVHKEEAAVETIGALVDRSGDRHLDVGRRRQGYGVSLKNLAASLRRMIRSAFPAPRKGHGRQGPGKDEVVRGSHKGRTFQKKFRARPKRSNGIRDRGLRREPHLGSNEIFYEALG
jgi:hypothetical protein